MGTQYAMVCQNPYRTHDSITASISIPMKNPTPQWRRLEGLNYPSSCQACPGVKGYLIRDVATHHYFVSHDVIFNENLPSMFPIEGMNELPADVAPPPTHLKGAYFAPIPPCNVVQHNWVFTPASRAVCAELEVTLKHLLDLCAWREACVKATQEEHDCTEGNSGPGALEVAAVLDVVVGLDGFNEFGGEWLAAWAGGGDFGSRCNAAPDKFKFITFHSEKVHCPLAPHYNMKLPPATLKEVSLHLNWPVWKAATEKELKTMRDMGVYKLTLLPPGHQEIGS